MPRVPSASERRSTAAILATALGLQGDRGVTAVARLLALGDGSLGGLTSIAHPVRIPGIGRATLDRLSCLLELAERIARETPPSRSRLRGPDDVAEMMAPRLRHLRQEEFHVLSLDTRHRILRTHIVSRGLLDASLVHPREVFAPALEARASAVILVHNHPSGDPEPSPEDHRVTRQMIDAGHLLGIRVLDHVVIGNPGWRAIAPSP